MTFLHKLYFSSSFLFTHLPKLPTFVTGTMPLYQPSHLKESNLGFVGHKYYYLQKTFTDPWTRDSTHKRMNEANAFWTQIVFHLSVESALLVHSSKLFSIFNIEFYSVIWFEESKINGLFYVFTRAYK